MALHHEQTIAVVTLDALQGGADFSITLPPLHGIVIKIINEGIAGFSAKLFPVDLRQFLHIDIIKATAIID